MTIRELIAKLNTYPLDTEVYDIGEDRGQGYSRTVVSPIGGIKTIASPPGITLTVANYELEQSKAALIQMHIDMINKQRKGLLGY